MKTIRKILIAACLILITSALSAQNPPHPNGGSSPGSGNTPVGGGAPVSGGLIVLLSLGLGYGARRIYDIRRNGVGK
ncbi:MAG: hypothetical protein K9G76_10895 [Bacteroidales bacterium]|nr:hypothetical protein [Bacteroidales bacterium]MCF8404899.1 hypothetical protein [Bacteroidales bacterium]